VVVAYLLAAICILVPLAVLGAVFAGIVLARRNRARDGVQVIMLGVACTALGLVLWG
jgi:hypothetical protein